MATLDTRSFATIVGNIAVAVQGQATILLDYSIGSVLRAIAESEAGVALWLQGLILQLLTTTRAATSSGTDLDTWVADYGVTRLGGAIAQGLASFSRFSSTTAAVVPLGAVIRTSDASQSFTVIADPTNPLYDAAASGYDMAVGVTTISVLVQANLSGSAANVGVGTITQIASSTPGIDYVANAVAISGGSDPETDAQLRARFVLFIASLSKGTVGALGYSILAQNLGLAYSIVENKDYDGTPDLGMVTVYVDDGTGACSSTLVQSAQTAVNLYRAASVRVGVYAATPLFATISMTVNVIPGYAVADVSGAVSAAITIYVNALALGAPLYYTRLAFLCYGVPGVQEVSNITLNSSTSDLIATAGQVIKMNSISVSAS